MVPIDNRAQLAAAALAELERTVRAQPTLEEVIRGGGELAAIVVQDEYTHDVVMVHAAPVHLVYDTT
jgi:hypothetical protein